MILEPGFWIACGVAFCLAIWVLMNLKTSRPDGDFLRTHPYRTMLSHLIPWRNTGVVFFDSYAEADQLLAYIEQARQRFECDITHCVVGAYASGLARIPQMNRFVIGHRLYQRRGIFLTFSIKRKKLDREAKLSAIKLEALAGETFAELCQRINQQIGIERSDAVTHIDKEFRLLLTIPRPFLAFGVRLLRWLDYHNLISGSSIRDDTMYTSAFIANLGSLGMAAGYHHLYEWGTCPLFVMLGQIEERAVVKDGEVVARKVLPIRYTYDERIDDALNARFGIEVVKRILEQPFVHLGCLAEDKSDAVVLSAGSVLSPGEGAVANGDAQTEDGAG